MAVKNIHAQLGKDMGEINHHIVVDNLAIHNFPEVHIANFDAFSCGIYTHEIARMQRLLPPKGRGPFAHVKAGLIHANFFGKRGLEWFLPVVLEFLDALFRSTTSVANPVKALAKKFANIHNAVVIQAINHTFDNRTGLFGLRHVSITR